MKTSTLLKRAKRHLWNGKGDFYTSPSGKEEHICLAIEAALGGEWYFMYIPICQDINNRLEGTSDLLWWLRSKGITIDRATDMPRLQAHRKQWVDQLIAEYQMKGD